MMNYHELSIYAHLTWIYIYICIYIYVYIYVKFVQCLYINPLAISIIHVYINLSSQMEFFLVDFQ